MVLAFTMGSTADDPSRFLTNVHNADNSNIASTMFAGVIFNLANLLLVAGIDMAGLAIAFPVAIGIALVVGVVSSYILQPKGHAGLLAAGVVCALVAVILDGKAYGSLPSANRAISRKSIVTCVVSGILMGVWAPFVTRSMTHGNTLGPYSVAVFLTLGALLSCFVWNIYFMKHPLVGQPVNFADLFRGPAAGHVLGLLGGCIWGIGTVFNLVAANFTGVAISYAIGQSAPMVAALVGGVGVEGISGRRNGRLIFIWRLMFLFYFFSILVISYANTAS